MSHICYLTPWPVIPSHPLSYFLWQEERNIAALATASPVTWQASSVTPCQSISSLSSSQGPWGTGITVAAEAAHLGQDKKHCKVIGAIAFALSFFAVFISLAWLIGDAEAHAIERLQSSLHTSKRNSKSKATKITQKRIPAIPLLIIILAAIGVAATSETGDIGDTRGSGVAGPQRIAENSGAHEVDKSGVCVHVLSIFGGW
eukprot:CAMPEP_0178471034 /NCGR_PEP_ID=MMETSP0696-20121128/832_1 /TAXON_ID=265572 /ORGANISM="Extubocellulus spinifer, Strain CCMP396" /LENGTH=201 /DNA_ID=CAMNT_0020098151 /DNA_START=304 /DNA_END=906 /DNA_ORIENTATION=-